MPEEPSIKRTAAFFDGQNLFHHARAAFGSTYPDYCPLALATRICADHELSLHEIRFYAGIPDPDHDPFWNHFWSAKLLAMSRKGIKTFSRPLRHRKRTIQISDGIDYTGIVGEEKGIDVRIALEVIRMARQNLLDVAVVFSQDQDFSEVADEIRALAREQRR
jgi:uncharacterized LabA/DUF88 family protein